jgi:hypothetical protein
MTDEALIKFCFDIFDVDRGGSLDMAELDALVRMLTGTDEVTGSLKKTLENIDADGDGEVSLEEMYGYNKEFPELLLPAFDLRDKLMEQMYGKSFWKEMTKTRVDAYGAMETLEAILLSERKKRKAEEKAKAAELKAIEDQKQAEMDAEAAAKEKSRLAKLKEDEVKMKAAETETETELREALKDLTRCTNALVNFRKGQENGEELDDNEDAEEIEKNLKSILVEALSRAVAANVMNHDNSLRLAEVAVKSSTKEFVDAYFETEIGKKYFRDLVDNEILLFQREGGFLKKADRIRLKEAAYTKYFDRKYNEIVAATRLKYDRFHDDMIQMNFKLKKDTVKVLKLLELAHQQWAWLENYDSATGQSYYYCEATGASLWEAPVNNVLDTCFECKRNLCTTLRCAQCGIKEYCRECDPTIHFGQLQHHERQWIVAEELDWRRRKRWFDAQCKKNKETFYYMDLMQLPDELDLKDQEAEDEQAQIDKKEKAKALAEARRKKREEEEFGSDNGGSSYDDSDDGSYE